MSLFTGNYPSAHGTHFTHKTSPPTVYPVARDLQLLPEIIRRAGCRTAAWTGGGQVSSRAGFERGFDRFSEDLGEEFLEHNGLLHEKLYRETLHVPLILVWPAGLPGEVLIDSQVPLIDLGATLLELASADTPPQMEGRSLLPLIQAPVEVDHRFAFSEEPWEHETHHRSIRDGSRTLYDHGTGKIELFSVVEDPFEHVDIFPTQPDLAVEMQQRLLEFITTHGLLQRDSQEKARELSSDEIEALRALGYIE